MMRSLLVLALPLALSLTSAPPRPAGCGAPVAPTTGPRAVANDNRVPAGRRVGDTLELSLVIAPARWYPEGDAGCALPVYAFAEEGKAPSVPGPLVRVPQGTLVRARVRNDADRVLWLRGFEDRPAAREGGISLPPGETREVAFRLSTAGTYGYRVTLTPGPLGGDTEWGQLAGAMVVDEPGAPAVPRDRVMVLGRYIVADTLATPRRLLFIVTTMNGRSWPHTERLSYAEGDSVHWRVVNLGNSPHPMHLHGFYYRIEAKGRLMADTVLARPPLVVTERVAPGETMRLSWKAERAGNWLFHCHLLEHMGPGQRLARLFGDTAAASPQAGHHGNHAEEGMAGLVVGITVTPRAGAVAADAPRARRTLRLYANERPTADASAARYGFVLQQGARAPARDSVTRPGAPILLRRGEPVRIVVMNRLTTPLSVHWHGMELESAYDGVGDWSGATGSITPPLAPGDSFAAYMTPPRAGTFIYHTHGEHDGQLAGGLYGPLLVLDDPAARDTTLDQVVILGDMTAERGSGLLVNGSTSPPITLVAGRRNRLRFIGINSSFQSRLTFLQGADTLRWRVVARDGVELPEPSPPVAAVHRAFPGTTTDVVLEPAAPGELTLVAQHGTLDAPPLLPGYVFREWRSTIRVVPATARAARRE